MSATLEGLTRALAERDEPLILFIRDDDAGWEQARLERLIALCGAYRLPLDVAVIPAAVDRACASALLAQRTVQPSHLGFHQHGWSHANHEPAGRPCEFGPSRSLDMIVSDIRAGQDKLQHLLGSAFDPIFTPPWNRCTPATAAVLRDCGFTVLSRDATAIPAAIAGLVECPTTLDWFAKRHGQRLAEAHWLACAADQLRRLPAVGLLLHHAVMDEREFSRLEALFAILAASRACRPCALLSAAAQARVLSAASATTPMLATEAGR